MKKLKHNKLRNSGLIFEILTRMSIQEVMNGLEPISLKLIKRHFKPGTEIFNEMKLYETLSKQSRDKFPEELLTLSIQSRKTLNENNLKTQKYILIKEIKKKYDLNDFFGRRVTNYKLLASIYKLFECKDVDNPEEYINTKTLVLEHISGKPAEQTKSEVDVIMEETGGDKDLIKLGLRVIVEKFNDKYKNLLPKQKQLLKTVINEDTNSEKFRSFLNREIKYVISELTELKKDITDPVTKIKVNESLQLIGDITKSPLIKDEHLSAMLKYYELVNALQKG